MIPWEQLAEAPVPGQDGRLQLMRRGSEYVIRVDGRDLMSSRTHGSERALAELTCAELNTPDARIAIGGLGMGFTLAAALEQLNDDATVVVAELVPAVVEWNRGVLGEVAGRPLDDPRVEVVEDDVRVLLVEPARPFDAILLDVDNGPDALTQPANAWLYEPAGLRAAFAALAADGVLAVWSAFEDPQFTRRLRAAGFDVETVGVRARGKKGSRHTIWLARRPRNRAGAVRA